MMMNLQRWSAMLVVAALAGLVLTQTGCPSADKTPPPSDGGGISGGGVSPGSSAPSAEATPAPAEEAAPTEEAAPEAMKESAPAPEETSAPAPKEEAPPAPKKEAAPEKSEPAAEDSAVGTPVDPEVPLGLPPVPVPEDNPMTEEKIALGRMLYFDTRLSKDETVSCATCHDPKMAWAEHRATSQGIDKQIGGANSPTVINAAYATSQFWDGRAASLEEQALGPIENPIEMGHSLPECCTQLSQVDEYKASFEKAFGTPEVTSDRIAKAIASFERTVLSGNSPYDKYKNGDEDALNDAQKHGLELFESVGCSTCHTPPLFSNYRFYNAGIGMDKEKPDEGRKAVTGKDSDLGKYRVPALREVANTYPYFHDGSVESLEEAVTIMAHGGKPNDNLSNMLKAVGEEKLSDQDIKDIVAFLKSLSGEYPKE